MMKWCKFLVVSRWSWDSSHVEYATFTIEGSFEKADFPAYLEKHRGEIQLAIRDIVKAQDGSTMGSADYRALFVVDSIDDLEMEKQISISCNHNHQPVVVPLIFNLRMLCYLDIEGRMIFI